MDSEHIRTVDGAISLAAEVLATTYKEVLEAIDRMSSVTKTNLHIDSKATVEIDKDHPAGKTVIIKPKDRVPIEITIVKGRCLDKETKEMVEMTGPVARRIKKKRIKQGSIGSSIGHGSKRITPKRSRW